MGQLIHLNKFDSAADLDKIMYSYRGRSHSSVMIDRRGLTVLLSMLVQGEIVITEHTYPYDANIRDDKEMLEVYHALALRTRWRMYAHTEIEEIRINALREMSTEGVPSYDDYICYHDGQVCVHCGNIDPTRLLTDFAQHPELKYFYIFTYPRRTKGHIAKYYCFEFSKEAHNMAVRYQNDCFDLVRKLSEKYSFILPKLPVIEDEPTE